MAEINRLGTLNPSQRGQQSAVRDRQGVRWEAAGTDVVSEARQLAWTIIAPFGRHAQAYRACVVAAEGDFVMLIVGIADAEIALDGFSLKFPDGDAA